MLSMHADDDGSTENILNLSEAELAIRKVDMVDIAFDDVSDHSVFLNNYSFSFGVNGLALLYWHFGAWTGS